MVYIGKREKTQRKNDCEQSLRRKTNKRLEVLARPTEEENREAYNIIRTQTRKMLWKKVILFVLIQQ